jgi:3-hydroxyisobutyrate dehydrogenase-like beta-hydroxyacid dehydrogenase
MIGNDDPAAVKRALPILKCMGLIDIVNTSTGQSFVSTMVMKQFVIPQTYNTGFKVGLISKDATIAAEVTYARDESTLNFTGALCDDCA